MPPCRQGRPCGRRHTRREGRGVQLMVGQQHQHHADQLRALLIAAPGLGQAGVNRSLQRPSGQGLAGHRLPGERVGEGVEQSGRLRRQRQTGPSPRGRVARRPAGQQGEDAGAGCWSLWNDARGAVLERHPVAAAQQSRHLFQRLGLRQLGGVPAPIVQPPVHHGGDGRGQHRLAPGDGVLRHQLRLAIARLAGLQTGDVVGQIEALARIVAIGPGLDPSPADIGVERLRPHPKPRLGLRRRDPLGHVDSIDQD
jgi:hypothetical protein